jgi:hypothetical protein
MTDRPTEILVADTDALDAAVLAAVDGEWRKVALALARATDAARAAGLTTDAQSLAQRLYFLVEQGRLDARGNVRRWRAGEVKAK